VEALRQAQIEMQRAFPHPFRWAAFGSPESLSEPPRDSRRFDPTGDRRHPQAPLDQEGEGRSMK
jgi:hypothetical protein